MTKLITAIVFSAFCLVSACGGGSPADKLAGRMDKLLSILEDNKADVKKAAEGVQAYVKENEAALKAEMAEFEKWGEEMETKYKDDPEGAAKVQASAMEKLSPLMDRMKKLMMENPELMQNEAIREAMSSVK